MKQTCADEEPSGFEPLSGIPHHAFGLLEALEAVVERELAADNVEQQLLQV